uniref:Uncharacterized protein n=1 Tax=Bacteroides fragilis TaxID=817 RepID=A0A0I9S9G3_BACFG
MIYISLLPINNQLLCITAEILKDLIFSTKWRQSPMDYLGKFFTGIFNGCRDFWSLAPQNIDLAVRQ